MLIRQENYFVDLFMDFYKVLLKIQTKALSNKQISEIEMEKMHLELKETLEKQAISVSMKSGAFIYDCYRELQYCLCGLADETMLFLDWIGKKWWRDHLLEHALFQTHTAGEQIFNNLDKMLESHSSYKKSLLVTYLYLLSLGFLGKYNLQDDATQKITKYKEDIFFNMYGNHIIQYDKEDLLHTNSHINQSTNLIRIEKEAVVLWSKRFLYILGAYLLCSHILWGMYMYPLSNIATSITDKIQKIKKHQS